MRKAMKRSYDVCQERLHHLDLIMREILKGQAEHPILRTIQHEVVTAVCKVASKGAITLMNGKIE